MKPARINPAPNHNGSTPVVVASGTGALATLETARKAYWQACDAWEASGGGLFNPLGEMLARLRKELERAECAAFCTTRRCNKCAPPAPIKVPAGNVASAVSAALATALDGAPFQAPATVSAQYRQPNAGYLGVTSPRSLAVTSAPVDVKGDETLLRFGRAFRRPLATGDASSPRMIAVVSRRSPLAVYTATRHEIVRRVYRDERERELATIRKGEIRENTETACSAEPRDRNRPEAKGQRSSAVFDAHVVAPSKSRQHTTALPCDVASYGDVCNATSPRFNVTAKRVVAARRAARKLAKSIDRLAARFGASLTVAVKGDVTTFARAIRFVTSPVARASMRTAYRAHVASMVAPYASADLTALATRSGVPTVAPRLPALSLVKVLTLDQRLASAVQRLASITARQGVKGVMPD